MYIGPFESARSKVKRANKHIDDLRAQLAAFSKSCLYLVFTKKDSDDGMFVATIRQTAAVPEDVPLLIGDAAHNLRAALDILMCDVLRHYKAVPSKHVKFPIFETRDQLVAAVKGGQVNRECPPSVSDTLINNLQPYVGGAGDSLLKLHDLDIQDKHILIVPVFTVTEVRDVVFIDTSGNSTIVRSLAISESGEFNPMASSAEIKIEQYGSATTQVLFDKGCAFSGLKVIPALAELSQLVRAAIEKVEQACSV